MTSWTAPGTGDAGLQPLGHSLVTTLHAAAKALRVYPLQNATVQKTLDHLESTVSGVLRAEGTLQLVLVRDFFFLNDVRLRLDLSDYASFAHVGSLLQRHGIAEVALMEGVQRSELVALLSLLLEDPASPTPEEAFAIMEQRLSGRTAGGLDIGPARPRAAQADDRQGAADSRTAAKRTYFQSIQVAKEVLTAARLGRAANLQRVKRAVQAIVDQVMHDEASLVGMTALRDYDEYTFTHSVNVCIISVVLGQKLGLSRLQLYDLGLGALYHDLGKQRIPLEILNKPGALDPEEWRRMQEHPTEGLLMLFGLKGLSEVPYRAMLIAYEHHMKRDLTGYPENVRPRSPTLYSRLVAVADAFDAATSKRAYNQRPWPPDEVLREMRDEPSRGFDPFLVKALISVTGVFPAGTVCILDTHELAVVTERNPDPARIHQPIVKIVADGSGLKLADPPVVDLAETAPGTGRPRRMVVKTIQPERFGIRVSDYFL